MRVESKSKKIEEKVGKAGGIDRRVPLSRDLCDLFTPTNMAAECHTRRPRHDPLDRNEGGQP
jgi:hypothetical protein